MSDQTVSEKTTDFVSKNIIAIGSAVLCIMTWGYTVGVKYTEVDIKIQAQQKDIDELKSRQSETDKTVRDITNKLDVAVAILQRIEKTVEGVKPNK
jgi:hypothetical protein